MKEIYIARLFMAFIGITMVGLALYFSFDHRESRKDSRFTAFDTNGDYCNFLLPDGSLYIPADEFEGQEVVICSYIRKP